MPSKGTKGSGKTVAEYVKSLSPERRKAFGELRALVSKELPKARLTMAYSMPTWEINGPVIKKVLRDAAKEAGARVT